MRNFDIVQGPPRAHYGNIRTDGHYTDKKTGQVRQVHSFGSKSWMFIDLNKINATMSRPDGQVYRNDSPEPIELVEGRQKDCYKLDPETGKPKVIRVPKESKPTEVLATKGQVTFNRGYRGKRR